MSIPQSANGIANILRLAGLKNVSGRRKVMSGIPTLDDLDEVNNDVSGTAQDNAPIPENLPEVEMGGELTPQSYDVRANKIMQPKENALYKIGRSLANHVQGSPEIAAQEATPVTPPIETQEVDLQEGLPPVSASQEEGTSWLDSLKKFAAATRRPGEKVGEAIREYIGAEAPRPMERIKEGLKSFTPSLSPEFEKRFPGAVPETSLAAQAAESDQLDQAELDLAQQHPYEYAVYGATNAFSNSPELIKGFQEYTGTDFTPEQKEMTEKYEKVMSDLEKGINEEDTGYDDQAKRIKQRILDNQATDADKYYIGMALLMPLLVGGIFGKEAGLGALGGAAQSIANIYGGRAQENLKNEELLAEINKNRSAQEMKNAELMAKNAPIKAEKTFIRENPETGQVEQFEQILPGFVVPARSLVTEKDKEHYRKAASELADVKNYTDQLNELTENVIEIVSQLKNPTLFSQYLGARFSKNKNAPGILSKITQDINYHGRKANAGILLENQIGLLSNQYARAQKLGQLDRAAQEHMSKLISNPTASFTSPQDAIEQLLSIRNLTQNGYARSLKNQGFIPEFATEEFQERNKKLYGALNTKEATKKSQSETRE